MTNNTSKLNKQMLKGTIEVNDIDFTGWKVVKWQDDKNCVKDAKKRGLPKGHYCEKESPCDLSGHKLDYNMS